MHFPRISHSAAQNIAGQARPRAAEPVFVANGRLHVAHGVLSVGEFKCCRLRLVFERQMKASIAGLHTVLKFIALPFVQCSEGWERRKFQASENPYRSLSSVKDGANDVNKDIMDYLRAAGEDLRVSIFAPG